MLDGKTAIITGASSGIGAALSVILAKEGMNVVLGSRRLDRLRTIAAQISASGGKCRAIQVDVTDSSAAESMVNRAIEEFGSVDILVNNAGRGHFGSIEDTTDIVLHNMFAVNVFSLWYTSRPAIRQMKHQKSGHIINVASMAGKLGYPYNGAYVAAKHACVGFTHALRQELLDTGINATVVCPAGVRTDWAASTEGGSMLSFFAESGPAIKRIADEKGIPLPSIEGVKSADEIARKILECIMHPVAEVYTHTGSREFVILAEQNREKAEQQQAAVILGEREVYERMKGGVSSQ